MSMHRTIPILTVVVFVAALDAALGAQSNSRRSARSKLDQRVRIAKLVLKLDDRDREVWQSAMQDLTSLRGDAVLLLAARVRMKSDPNTADRGRTRAVQVLFRIGKDAVPAARELVRVLPDAPVRVQAAIVLALGRIGPYAGKQRTRIREAMEDLVDGDQTVQSVELSFRHFYRQHVQVHQEAFRTHARMALDPGATVAELVTALKDSNPFVREFAAELLGDPRRRDETAMTTLAKMLGETQPGHASMGNAFDATAPAMNIEIFYDRRIHNQVALAMVRMAPGDPRSLPAYRFLLTRPTSWTRLEGLIALRRAGPLAAKLLPTLLPMAKREDRQIRREAIMLLGMIGPAARDAIPLLMKLEAEGDAQIAALAKAALAGINRR